MDEKQVFILYYDLEEVYRKMTLGDFIEKIAKPIMDKFNEVGKCAIMIPKNEVTWKEMSKEEALKQIKEIKEYIETWE